MNTLLQNIKADRLEARKNKEASTASILTTLLGELETQFKKDGIEVSDTMVIARCKKFIEGISENLKFATGDKIDFYNHEIAVLEKYLPKQLLETEIVTILSELKPANVKVAMEYLKVNYAGRYNGQLASKVAKDLV